MELKKAAYVATVYSHLAAFHLPFMEDLRRAGYEVHAYAAPDHRRQDVAAAGFAVRDIPFSRNPLSPGNIEALKQMTAWLKRERYDIVHVHTPNAGFITRLAARAVAGRRARREYGGALECSEHSEYSEHNKNNECSQHDENDDYRRHDEHSRNNEYSACRVFYTAHGFHFYKGAPLLNWLLYYPLERLAARLTDVLITINDEDYLRAARFHVRGKTVLLPGVGVEGPHMDEGHKTTTQQQVPESLAALKALGVLGGSENPADLKPFIILCMAELNRNKNQEQLLRAVRLLREAGIPAVCLLAGIGPLEPALRRLAEELGIGHAVRFLGYRSDGPHLMAAADVVALASRREGLPKVLLEALSAGKPVVATDVRGSRDLVRSGENGFLAPVGNAAETAAALMRLYRDRELAKRMGARSRELAEPYRLDKVRAMLAELYAEPAGTPGRAAEGGEAFEQATSAAPTDVANELVRPVVSTDDANELVRPVVSTDDANELVRPIASMDEALESARPVVSAGEVFEPARPAVSAGEAIEPAHPAASMAKASGFAHSAAPTGELAAPARSAGLDAEPEGPTWVAAPDGPADPSVSGSGKPAQTGERNGALR